MRLPFPLVLILGVCVGLLSVGAQAAADKPLNVYLYNASGSNVELFAVDFSMPSDKRHEPIELFNEARVQCKRLGFATAKRREVTPALLNVGDQKLQGSLLRYTCINTLG